MTAENIAIVVRTFETFLTKQGDTSYDFTRCCE
jgi:hypothetical protein